MVTPYSTLGNGETLQTPTSPRQRFSTSSSGSGASLRALEMSDGPIKLDRRPSNASNLSALEYRPDLLPLTLSEEAERADDAGMEKTVGLVNG